MRLAALASGSRSGVRRTVVTPKEILLCIHACMCMRVPNVVSSSSSLVGPDICASFFPFATTALCCCLLGSFPYLLRSAIPLFSSRAPLPEPSFALSRHRVAHTLRGRQRSEGTGPTEDRKDVNASPYFSSRSISDEFQRIKCEGKKILSNFESSVIK